jgi:restriction endonuclease
MTTKKPKAVTKTKLQNQNQSHRRNSANKQKGNLVEKIAAMLHESPGVKVERNVFLSPGTGNSDRKREIDVLLTAYVANYPVRIALECKNEGETTGVEHIDAFVGKLDDVGIPHQHGIYISASGYTSGAIDRAKAKGIRTLALIGLTEDRLSTAISEAWQYTVFLLLVVKSVTVTNHVAQSSPEVMGFFNERGELCGLLPDLIWFKWQAGEIDLALGEREIDLQAPPEWRQIIKGKLEPPIRLSAVVEVIGIVLRLKGKARQHSLVDACSDKTEKFHLDVDFNTRRLHDKRLVLKHFFTEKKLQAWIEKHGGTRMVNRVQLPRLQYLNQFYYPMSERVAGIVMNQMLAYEGGQLSEFPIFSFNELEGAELKTAWEPIFQAHYHLWRRAFQEEAGVPAKERKS